MRLPKRYLINVLKKRLIEFILMFSVISIVIFGIFMTEAEARSDTGILFQLDDNYWCIHSNYRNSHNYLILGIENPQSFPHVLIPENNGKEVHYIHSTHDPPHSLIAPPHPYFYIDFFYVFTLDLVPVLIIKQSILYICIIAIFSIALPYFYLNRKRFQFTNKLLG